ncbi:nicotinic acid mononucleotide adenyltransferase [Oceaniovalibus guishaninsula JLT2003]|uniref:Probable nicotinate-nucleotide adenylyltransferase n=2 Tax=Oceaniovalibus TaxID=1207070 RepID=K2HFP1_9RHOB|nr:nicotinic acid mononucleotide adenyltransferase [Oceaniovalibus guishaninsula JLT2003]
MAVGLLGGSFDPAHPGHVHVSRAALARFALDRLWWLVSPGNPLKPRGPAPLARRIDRARAVIAGDPRIAVTDIEARLGTRYTAETLSALLHRYPGIRFVWLMGADNLADFHRWQDWRGIMGMVPVGILARPGQRISARRSVAARTFAPFRLPAPASRLLARSDPPVWCFVNIPMRDDSSTALRRGGVWPPAPPQGRP